MSGALVFPRGSHVLEYWLAHSEGFTVRSHGPVEQVIVEPLYGRATALVIRTGVLRRREVVSAAAVTAVDPEARVLELEEARPAPSTPRAPSRVWSWLGPRLRTGARETWAVTLTSLAGVAESLGAAYARAVEWYAARGDARAATERGAAGARARRPRGAVGRHLRP